MQCSAGFVNRYRNVVRVVVGGDGVMRFGASKNQALIVPNPAGILFNLTSVAVLLCLFCVCSGFGLTYGPSSYKLSVNCSRDWSVQCYTTDMCLVSPFAMHECR